MVRDQEQNYVAEEDPTTFVSDKTGRGPLDQDWLENYSADCVGRPMPTRQVLHSHWSSSNKARLSLVESFRVLLRQQFYAIKNQIGPPY